MGVKLRHFKKGDTVNISGEVDQPAYEDNERWLELSDKLWNADSFEEENKIMKEMDEIEKSNNENNTHKEDSI